MKKIERPQTMFQIVKGTPKPVSVFTTAIAARRYETAKAGVCGYIQFEGRIVAVKSSFDSKNKNYPGPWLHVFVKPLRGDAVLKNGFVSGVQASTQNWTPPRSRTALIRETLKAARFDQRDTARRHKREVREIARKLALAERTVREAAK